MVSKEALCIMTGFTPIHIEIKLKAEQYKIVRGNRHNNLQIDNDKPSKKWLHPANRIIATNSDSTQKDVTPINIYTNGSKSEQGVGVGIAIIIPGTPTVKLMYRIDTRCTNKQA